VPDLQTYRAAGIYPNAAEGIAQVTSDTNQVTLKSGTAFSTSWVGLPYFYYEGTAYKVASVADSSHLTVQTLSCSLVTDRSWPSLAGAG
jgi:hypothetical protein